MSSNILDKAFPEFTFFYEVFPEAALNVAAAATVAMIVQFGLSLFQARLKKRSPSYSERVSKLAENLARSSKEVDEILDEIASVTSERQLAAEHLEKELERLSASEDEIKRRIDTLKNVPIPVAEHFAKLLDSGDKRSARRDYLLFGAGVLTSIVSAIGLKWLGFA